MGANESAQAHGPAAPPPRAPAPDGDMSALVEEFRAHYASAAGEAMREFDAHRAPVVRAFIDEFKAGARCGVSRGDVALELGRERSSMFVDNMAYKYDIGPDVIRRIVGDFLGEAFPPAPGEECAFFTDTASGGDARDNFGVAFGACE